LTQENLHPKASFGKTGNDMEWAEKIASWGTQPTRGRALPPDPKAYLDVQGLYFNPRRSNRKHGSLEPHGLLTSGRGTHATLLAPVFSVTLLAPPTRRRHLSNAGGSEPHHAGKVCHLLILPPPSISSISSTSSSSLYSFPPARVRRAVAATAAAPPRRQDAGAPRYLLQLPSLISLLHRFLLG
jgi:hypothetical protein